VWANLGAWSVIGATAAVFMIALGAVIAPTHRIETAFLVFGAGAVLALMLASAFASGVLFVPAGVAIAVGLFVAVRLARRLSRTREWHEDAT